MSGHPGRAIPIILILCVIFLGYVGSTAAQSAYTVTLFAPDISNFPDITAFLDVNDSQGGFVHGLTAGDVSIQENGIQVDARELDDLRPGVQLVIAISSGDSFTIRDNMGISRYAYFLQDFLAGTWVNEPPGVDDFSLLTIGGPQVTHSSAPVSLLSSLHTYHPEDQSVEPSLEVLSAALQVVADPTIRPGMERAILFITPPLTSDVSVGLQSIIASASQQNIHIFVWLIAAPEVVDLPETSQLRNLADQTHGSFFAFSHDENVPDLENLLEPLRHVYMLGYDSQINTAGMQQISAQVTIGTDVISTTVHSFQLNLQAPVPAIINPPAQITRKFSTQSITNTTDIKNELQPVEQPLTIQVTYPDGYERPLMEARLYVDGVTAAEKTTPPFDQLTWDLLPYTQEAVHTLSVVITDSLGLVGRSADIPVQITVPSSKQGVIIAVSQRRPLVIGATVIISASILVLVLILGGRIRPKLQPGQVIQPAGANEKTRPSGYRQRMRQNRDPVTQPVKIDHSPPGRLKVKPKKWRIQLPWLKKKTGEQITALAYLVPLVGFDEPTIPAPLKISSGEVVLGSDPSQANLVITDPSIEAVHARLLRTEKTFRIMDSGSGAGTWVNYEQIPTDGHNLEHMDIIHLGSIGFRFKYSPPTNLRQIRVEPRDPVQ
jgi:hypothetical protein